MDITGRYDIGTSSGSLLDALHELQMSMCSEPDPEEATDAPSRHRSSDGWGVGGDEVVVIPEAAPDRRPAPHQAPRVRREPEAAASVPSVVDRIAAMPRFRTSTTIAHPTGAAWLAPTQRQFCERPPV